MTSRIFKILRGTTKTSRSKTHRSEKKCDDLVPFPNNTGESTKPEPKILHSKKCIGKVSFHDNATEPTRKEFKKVRNKEQCFDLMALPEDLIVRVGAIVANLCGVKDYLSLSLSSKRLHGLLLASKDTETEVCDTANAFWEKNRSTMRLPKFSSSVTKIQNLEELALYQRVRDLNLLHDNRLFMEFWPEVVKAARSILRQFPSVVLVLDAHCSDEDLLEYDSYSYADDAYNDIMDGHDGAFENVSENEVISGDRLRFRCWQNQVVEAACKASHPYFLDYWCQSWVEVTVYMRNINTGNILALPPRPDYYEGFSTRILPYEVMYHMIESYY